MKPKILKSEADYQEALAYLDTLMDAPAGSPEEEDLELFSVLIEQYEREHFPIDLPDPVDAILFRMEQQGLRRKDLVAYIGSQSKVSEVLNRKRPLSLAMIRALHAGLGIPAEVLLQAPGEEMPDKKYDVQAYPFNEMFTQDYFAPFDGSLAEAKAMGEELLTQLFSYIRGEYDIRILLRSSDTGQPVDRNALVAWQARVLQLAGEINPPPFDRAALTKGFMRDVIKLSYLEAGPKLAKELLFKKGIPLVFLAHLPHTYLDGACMNTPEGRPVIGITIRHDRPDNFWFTLAHELAHASLHLDDRSIAFFDETDLEGPASSNTQDAEANAFARDLLIPGEFWERERTHLINASRDDVLRYAGWLQVSPAIVAGRIRWERKDFTRLSQIVSGPSIRKLIQDGPGY
jgi:HTH-type transcriptional regulator / antitoxin HigA